MVTLLILVVPGVSYAAESGAAEQSGKVEIGGITGMIYSLCLALGGGLLWLGGMFLDYAVGFLVIGMGEILRGGLGVAVDSLWIVIRDIFNLLFIFGLIYIGFKTIWNAGEYNTRKFLITLIGAALLINFSLYITKAVVDFSNITAFQIYNLIEVEGVGGMIAGEYTGVASGFMQYLNLETLSDQSEAGILTQAVADDGELPNARILVYGFMVLIFSLVAAFVFAAGAVFLVTRFIALILYMIFSPAMFLGLVFPGFQSYSTTWWRGFINHALVAPAFLFMLYLSLTVARELQTGGTFAGALADTSGASGTFQIILMFFVITGFVIASLLVAKQLGAVGADRAVSIGNAAQKKIRGGVQGFAGRNTVGRGSNWMQNTFTQWQEKPSENQSRGGRIVRGGLAYTNLDRSIIDTTEKGKTAKFGGSRSFKDSNDYGKERRKRLTAGAAEQRREEQINAGIEATKSGAVGPLNPATMKAFSDAMKGLTDKQLTEDLKLEILTNENVAVHLNEKNVETLQKSGKYSDAQIADIKKARNEGFKNIATENNATGSAFNTERTPEWLAQKGTDEVAKMPLAVFTSDKMAPYLTPSMIEAKMKSGLKTTERDEIREKIDSQITAYRNAPSPAGDAYIKQYENWGKKNNFGIRLGLTTI